MEHQPLIHLVSCFKIRNSGANTIIEQCIQSPEEGQLGPNRLKAQFNDFIRAKFASYMQPFILQIYYMHLIQTKSVCLIILSL